MAGICSAHQGDVPVEGCEPCHATPRDLFPDWDQKLAEAEAAGRETCVACGFVFFRTVDSCPKCNHAALKAGNEK